MKNIIILDITVMSCHTHKSKAHEYAEEKLKELGFKDLSLEDWFSPKETLFETKTEKGIRLFIEVWHSESKCSKKRISWWIRRRILNRISFLSLRRENWGQVQTAVLFVHMEGFNPIGYKFITEA